MTTTLSARCLDVNPVAVLRRRRVRHGHLFSLFDPMDLRIFGEPISVSAMAAYTLGFLGFWAVAASAVCLALLLARPCMVADDK